MRRNSRRRWRLSVGRSEAAPRRSRRLRASRRRAERAGRDQRSRRSSGTTPALARRLRGSRQAPNAPKTTFGSHSPTTGGHGPCSAKRLTRRTGGCSTRRSRTRLTAKPRERTRARRLDAERHGDQAEDDAREGDGEVPMVLDELGGRRACPAACFGVDRRRSWASVSSFGSRSRSRSPASAARRSRFTS